jgi:hypothetical protein
MRLDFEVVPVAKHFGVPRGRCASLVVLIGEQVVGDFSRHARRGDHDALVVPGEELAVDAGLGVEALRVGEG